MRLIIAGSRTITEQNIVNEVMDDFIYSYPVTALNVREVVSGGANGVDKCGEKWAENNGIPVEKFPAMWETEGRGAGHIRNARMAEYVTSWGGCVAIMENGGSKGTESMIKIARKLGVFTVVYEVRRQRSGYTITDITDLNNPRVL